MGPGPSEFLTSASGDVLDSKRVDVDAGLSATSDRLA